MTTMRRWQRVAGLVVAAVLAAPAPAAQPTTKASRDRKGKVAKAAPRRTPAPPVKTAPNDDPRRTQAEQSAERDRLTARLAALKQQIDAGEKSRSGAAVALARAERALSDVNRRLDDLAKRQRAGQERIASLDQQRAGTESRIVTGDATYVSIATELYAQRDRDPVRIVLSGGDREAALLREGDLGYLLAAQASELQVLKGRSTNLQAQRARADDENRALAQLADAQKTARETLAADQAAQRETLSRLARQLAEQRNTASALQADERRLTQVVEQLQKAIDRQAAEEKARRDAARRAAEQRAARREAKRDAPQTRRTPDDPPPEPVDAVPDASVGGGAFALLRGQLRLPARGTITGRFGSPRGNDGGTWKGVFLSTAADADVHAVAAGRVVFADDLRGFGNLLIVDHGGQYLSIYGNNETLLKRSGEAVRPGDVIARAGNSSGDDRTGLYFELRFRGKPFDPMPWTGGR